MSNNRILHLMLVVVMLLSGCLHYDYGGDGGGGTAHIFETPWMVVRGVSASSA